MMLLGLCFFWASCSIPHQEKITFRDAEGNPLAGLPVRVELGKGLYVPVKKVSTNGSEVESIVSALNPETTRIVDDLTLEAVTDASGSLKLVYYDPEYDEYKKNTSGWRALFNWGGPPSPRRVTIVPLRDIPAGSRINVPTSHVKR